jgi:hypothetical protein
MNINYVMMNKEANVTIKMPYEIVIYENGYLLIKLNFSEALKNLS